MSIQDKVNDFTSKHKKISIAIIVVMGLAVLAMLLAGGNQKRMEARQAEIDAAANQEIASDAGGADTGNVGSGDSTDDTINGGTDRQIAQLQEALKEEYGTPPEGFVWDRQGNPISLGIKDMSSDDVVFSYTRALSSLDIGLAQKLSRDSTVVETYNGYFVNSSIKSQDYNDVFSRNAYRSGLLSLQINNVSDTSVFAENQRVYTVQASMIDFSNKDFWQADKDALFDQIFQYDNVENDSGKAETYVNDYIGNYYNSPDVKKHDVTFTLTLRKYPDLNTGWLVNVDKDLDDLLTNADGVSTNRYIMSEYQKYKQERLQKEREEKTNG